MRKEFLIIVLFLSFMQSPAMGQEWEELRYADGNGDGANDVFRDADGDGVNDVTGKPYHHRFTFEDADGDGANDLFLDADGDGENDRADVSGEIVTFPVIDYNDDGRNDVTGEKYVHKLIIRTFVDENGDGIDDRQRSGSLRSLMGRIITENGTEKQIELDKLDGPVMDHFIDENSDGINDGRSFNEPLEESIGN